MDDSRFLITHPADVLKITCPHRVRRVPVNGTFVVKMSTGCMATTKFIAIDRDMYEYESTLSGLFHNTPLTQSTIDHLLVSIPNSTFNLSSILSDNPMPIHKIQSVVDFDRRLQAIDISHSQFHIPFLARVQTLILHGLVVIAVSVLIYFGLRLLISCVAVRHRPSGTSSGATRIPMGAVNAAGVSTSTQQLNQQEERPFNVS